tara:strand:+ start:2764 stop:3174 length:411 start_codon:yes stop_codon:yes gene_type:complete
MSEKKCNSEQAEFYVNDLFDYLEIKGNNQSLFNEFCKLLMKYSEDTVKKSWNDIIYSCELPNGQMAGRLPKMREIQNILFNNRVEKSEKEHNNLKKQNSPDGLVTMLFKWGVDLQKGKITEKELDNLINNYKGDKK